MNKTEAGTGEKLRELARKAGEAGYCNIPALMEYMESAYELGQAASEITQAPPEPTLTHARSCPALTPGEDCTCGLEFRIQLQTEREMHNAWRKRAEGQNQPILSILDDIQRTLEWQAYPKGAGVPLVVNLEVALDAIQKARAAARDSS